MAGIAMSTLRRKKNRLPGRVAYRGRGGYFLTLCAHQRRKLFADSQLVDVLLKNLRETCRNHAFGVYAYGFMPDHFHVILVGEKDAAELPRMVRVFKGIAKKAARARGIAKLWQ